MAKGPSLLDEATAISGRRGGDEWCCAMRWIRTKFNGQARAEVLELVGSAVSSPAVMTVLNRHYGPVPFTKSAMQEHRGGRCRCPK